MDELKKYIVRLPQALGYRDENKIKVNVYKALYYAIAAEGKYFDLLFHGIPIEDVVSLEGYSWPPKLPRRRPFYKYVVNARYTHPVGQTCGRTLKYGEPVYRCEECGYDDTCVLCVHCFNREDHIDHNVSVYVARPDSGGICDCGDETAFTSKLNCACQAKTEMVEGLPLEFRDKVRETLTVVLDYILNVANFSINTLPFIYRNVNGRGDLKSSSRQISDFGSLPSELYGAEDVNSDDIWYLVLWNDENHDYLEAETGIRAATGVNDDRAKELASEINSNGRAVLKVAKDYHALLKSQKSVGADGLVATICTARDYMRECIVLQMFNWLQEVLNFSGNSLFREHVKATLAELLLEPNFEFAKIIPAELLTSDSTDFKRACYENGLLYNGEFVNLSMTKLKPTVTISSLMKPTDELLRPAFEDTYVKSRIQYLLAFEIRFVSAVRKLFTKSILPVLFIDPLHKQTFCEQYIEIYPVLFAVLSLSDREEDLASTAEISVQLFTCPRTNMWVVNSGKLGNILGPLVNLIEHHSSKMNESGYPNLIDIIVDIRSKREKSSIQKSINVAIANFSRFVSKNDNHDILNVFLHHDNLAFLLLFLKAFQGTSSIVRKYGDHVERESLNDFYTFLQRTIPVLSIVKHIATVEHLDYRLGENAIQWIVDFLNKRKIRFSAPGIADFQVSKEPVSCVNPINTLLSCVLQLYGVDMVRDYFTKSILPFMHISDFSLRSIVWAAQVKVGFWIRNGIFVSRQAANYTDTSAAEISYYRDLHLNQVAAIFDDPRSTLYNFLERWELRTWYCGEVEHDQTIYEDRFGYICEQFIIFLYNLICDRHCFVHADTGEHNEYRAKKAICYALCDEPKTYSQLKGMLPSFALDLANLDDLIYQCADYQAPTGLTDVGVFRLRTQLYETLDPISLYLESSQFQSVSEVLYTNIAKLKGVDEKAIILEPEIYPSTSAFVNERIGEFTRSGEFSDLVYKLLVVAWTTKDEVFLPHLLHLIHAVLVDDEFIFGKAHVNSNIGTLHVLHMLRQIAESSMSVHVVLKADYLLDQFVMKDVTSFIERFGEEMFELLKRRSVGTVETESEKRKRLAEERKAKVMKKFAKQREKFMSKHDMEHEDHQNPAFPPDELLRRCVACGEVENANAPFGILFNITDASIFWKIPKLDSPYAKLAFGALDDRINPGDSEIYPHGYPYGFLGDSIEGRVASSCAHGIHLTCYHEGLLRNFPCPLCHNLHRELIHNYIYQDNYFFVDPKLLHGEPVNQKYNAILHSVDFTKNKKLLDTVVSKEYFDQRGLMKAVFTKSAAPSLIFTLKERETPLDFVRKLTDLGKLIADTIRATEISLRIDGPVGVSKFLKEVPSATKTLLRSLIQARVVVLENALGTSHSRFTRSSSPYAAPEDHMRPLFEKFWDESPIIDGAFNEIVLLFFQTGESFTTLARLGYAKMVAVSTYALYRNYSDVILTSELDVRISGVTKTMEALALFIETFVLEENEDRTLVRNHSFLLRFYFALERCLMPFLRQCIIMMDILTCKKVDQSGYKSDKIFETLEEKIDSQKTPYSSEALTQVLGLRTLDGFIIGIVEQDENLSFEYGILDIHFCAKIPGQLDAGILDIQYPNSVRLIDLPDDYHATITDPNYKSKNVTWVCLQCGHYITATERFSHMEHCSQLPIYFHPEMNMLFVFIHVDQQPYEFKIPAPYLTIHGEVKRERLPGKAILNKLRYDYLNKLWINQGLYGLVTRTLYIPGTNPAREGMAATAGLDEVFDDDSEDDFGDFGF